MGNIIIAIGYIMSALFITMLLFYLTLCFIQWIGDVIENKI